MARGLTGPVNRDRAALACTAVCAGVAVALVVAATARHGLGVSSDSVAYLHAAGDLAAGRAPLDAHGSPLAAWPPLYPASVAAVSFLTGQDVLDAARLVNITLVVPLVLVFAAMTRRLVADRALQALGVIAVAFGPTILLVTTRALSELLFTLLVLGAFWALVECRRRPTEPGLVLIAASLATAASMTRYVGLTLIAVGVLALASRPRAAVAYVLVAGAPVGAWLARNVAITASLAGDRPRDGAPTGDSTRQFLEGVAQWVGPAGPLAITVGVAAVGVLLAAVASAWRAALPGRRSAVPICLFVVLYPAAVLASATVVGIDPVSDRLLVPVFPPTLIVVLIALAGLTARAPGPGRRRIALAGLALWLAVAGAVTVHEIGHLSRNGSGFTAARWQGSALVDEVTATDPTEVVASNAPYALAFLTGRPAISWQSAEPGQLVAWFDDPDRPVHPRPVVQVAVTEVSDATGLSLLLERRTDDGRLLRVRED